MRNHWTRTAKEVIRIERDELGRLAGRIDANFSKACELIFRAKGRVVMTGVGKPSFIAQKISATLSSTGTPSLFLHPSEALHGDLGRVTRADVVIALSNSGQSEEITRLIPALKRIGAKIIAMTGNKGSFLAQHSDIVLDVSIRKEACPLNLAPTASTTNMLAMGDALALAILDRKGFKAEDFAFYHPGGSIGKRLLLKVSDIMRKGKGHAIVTAKTRVREVLYRITQARSGSATIVNEKGAVIGIFTDGDLRRHLKLGSEILNEPVGRVMTKRPSTIRVDSLAKEAADIFKAKHIDEIPVVDKRNRPMGLLDLQDLLKTGIL